jgi:hypothetical protein
MKTKSIFTIFAIVILFLICPIGALAFHHSPQIVYIGAQYNGEKLYVSGELQKDEDAIVQVVGSDEESHFKQKGKVWGIFWMTIGHLTFKHSPSVYLLYVPSTLSGSIEKLGLGYESLFSKIEIEPIPKNKAQVLKDFLKLKQKDKLYKIKKSGVIYTSKGNIKKFQAVVELPPKIPPGKYEIRVYKINKNQKIENVDKDFFEIKLKGFPKFISKMAFEHSLIYGIMAVIIAILAGFLMGFLFKDRGGAH